MPQASRCGRGRRGRRRRSKRALDQLSARVASDEQAAWYSYTVWVRMTKCMSANASMDRWQSARVGRQPGVRFVVALQHLVCVLAWIGPLLVSLAVGSPAATSLATAWRSSARPAQRHPAPLHPPPCWFVDLDDEVARPRNTSLIPVTNIDMNMHV